MISIKKGSTDQTFPVYAVDAMSGLPKTGLTYSDVTARYIRARSTAAAITPVSLASPDAAHSDGGFIEIDASNSKGWYRFDVPDAAFATGVDSVVVTLQADGALLTPIVAQLVDYSPSDIYAEVHLSKAALANKRLHTISTGVDVIKDDDGNTTLRTMTPSYDGDDTVTVTPS
jgi:hypothetical protein